MTIATQTELADRLRISEREWTLLSGILHRHIPEKAVWAFGSRATGKHIKRFSDLDLAIAGRLTPAQHTALSEALDEAPINFKVDLVELDLADADFRKRIEPDFVQLQGAVCDPSDSATLKSKETRISA